MAPHSWSRMRTATAGLRRTWRYAKAPAAVCCRAPVRHPTGDHLGERRTGHVIGHQVIDGSTAAQANTGVDHLEDVRMADAGQVLNLVAHIPDVGGLLLARVAVTGERGRQEVKLYGARYALGPAVGAKTTWRARKTTLEPPSPRGET